MITIECTEKIQGKRVYDRKHCCLFCSRMVSNIGRHLLSHKSEDAIKKINLIANWKKDETEKQIRQKECKRLRLLGDFYHNVKVLKIGGSLIVYRRPYKCTRVDEYKPCKYCLLFIHRYELWRHCIKCPYKGDTLSKPYSIYEQCSLILYPSVSNAGRLKLQNINLIL